MIKRKLELALEEKGHVVAEVQVYDVPRTLLKTRSNQDGSWMYLHRLWVARKYRKNGHAKRLMKTLLFITDAMGESLVLRVLPFEANGATRRCLIRFYESFGFRQIKVPFKDIMIRRVDKSRW